MSVRLMMGDCVEKMAEIESGSVDAIITDPPYPEISRPYGRMTESEWHDMMDRLVPECRRVLKPTGSAVFVLQPNSDGPGSMRPWLFEFQVKICRTWNMIQDAWWWNTTAIPEVHSIQGRLMRPSLKACVWCGPRKAYRDQDSVVWAESDRNKQKRSQDRFRNYYVPSGHKSNDGRMAAKSLERGGVTPFNVLPIPNSCSASGAGAYGHPAGTPDLLADWWTRYISPPSGMILDPFMGGGTMGLAALARNRSFIGIERDPGYFAIAERRIADAQSALPLFATT
jgi:site-specific DNA-methyltransferase (adenine-specific)